MHITYYLVCLGLILEAQIPENVLYQMKLHHERQQFSLEKPLSSLVLSGLTEN
jgi:hypothetical protein